MHMWQHQKMSCCGSFTVCIMAAELVVTKEFSIPIVREEENGGHHSAAVKMFIAEVRHPHRMSRIDLGAGLLRTSGFTIMVRKNTYFLQFLDLG